MSDFLGNLAARSLNINADAIQPSRMSRFEPTVPSPMSNDIETPDTFDTIESDIKTGRERYSTPHDLSIQPSEHNPASSFSERYPRKQMNEQGTEIHFSEPSLSGGKAPHSEYYLPTAQAPKYEKTDTDSELSRVSISHLTNDFKSTIHLEKQKGVNLQPMQNSISLLPHENVQAVQNTRAKVEDQHPLLRDVKSEIQPLSLQEDEVARLVKKLMPPLLVTPQVGESQPSFPIEPSKSTSQPQTPSVEISPRLALDVSGIPIPPKQNTDPPAPTINVTIGRIEVRATSSPSVVKAPKETARRGAELEAYLRQRAGGKNE